MTKLLIIILAVMIIIYIYNDFISPYITPYITPYIAKYFPQLTQNTENFSQQSSKRELGNNGFNNNGFDSNWYLRDGKPIVSSNQISLPIIKYGFYANGSYEDLVGQYFRHHIYPIETEQLITGLDTIYKFINDDIDIAFINEELLTRFIKKDCKYLTNVILDNLGLTTENYDLAIPDNIERLYPPINFSAIGVGFHQDFYLIVNNFSNIMEFLDIKTKTIGILLDSYYYFVKLCSAYGISPIDLKDNKYMQITIENTLEELITTFKTNKYDGIFIVAHPKNKQLLDLSLTMKLRYIHTQKRQGLDSRKNITLTTQQGTISKTQQPPPSINRQAIYSKTLMDDLHTENITETFNNIIKKYFQCITPRTVDLNKFHKSGNLYSYLETYSTRMILIVRNDIPKARVEYITRNYIDNLNKMRDGIDRQQFQVKLDNSASNINKSKSDKNEFQLQLNNFSSLEFNYDEIISFNSSIPLAEGAKEIYKKEGLIYYENDARCKI